MADGDTETTDDVEVDPLPPKSELDTMSRTEINQLISSLRTDIANLSKGHSQERAELREQIERLTEFKTHMEEAETRREQADAHDNTLVLPPNDIPPQQPSPPANPPELEHEQGGRKGWRRAW